MAVSPSSLLKKKALVLDKADPLKSFRKRFHYPQLHGKDSIYFCGNSLGLMPKGLETALQQECSDWSTWGVEGHWKAKNPWLSYHKPFSKLLAPLCGAKASEVVAMNSLTVNLHLAFASFYKPVGKRCVILYEAQAFSSDLYALESLIQTRGLTPAECLYPIDLLDSDSIMEAIGMLGDRLALVFLGGVNYYSGELLDMKKITAAAHAVGALAGFDLAHAIGNVPLKLHEWNTDFAVWCSYKYLNAGPGATGGLFIHQRHGDNPQTPRLAGWWGHQEKERFAMKPGFKPMSGAEGWQLSNAPVFNLVAQRLSLTIFQEATPAAVFKKGESMSAFFLDCLQTLGTALPNDKRSYAIRLITPLEKERRGCQWSIQCAEGKGQKLFRLLEKAGIVCDWREPDVIRLAPVPLYNSYHEIFRAAEVLCAHAVLHA